MKLHHKILIGMVLGLLWAIGSAFVGGAQFTQDWIAPFGTLFINAMKLIAVPLVLFSIIDGVSYLGCPRLTHPCAPEKYEHMVAKYILTLVEPVKVRRKLLKQMVVFDVFQFEVDP